MHGDRLNLFCNRVFKDELCLELRFVLSQALIDIDRQGEHLLIGILRGIREAGNSRVLGVSYEIGRDAALQVPPIMPMEQIDVGVVVYGLEGVRRSEVDLR